MIRFGFELRKSDQGGVNSLSISLYRFAFIRKSLLPTDKSIATPGKYRTAALRSHRSVSATGCGGPSYIARSPYKLETPLTTFIGRPPTNASTLLAVVFINRFRDSERRPGNVRGDQTVFRLQQRVIGADWFLRNDIEQRTADAIGGQVPCKVRFVNQSAPRRIDQHRTRLHFCRAIPRSRIPHWIR